MTGYKISGSARCGVSGCGSLNVKGSSFCLKHQPDLSTVVEGVGKDAPTVINELGGKQSKVLYRFDLLDPLSMFEMTKVLAEGAEKYGADNWRNIPIEDHLNHMIIHAYAYLAGDKSDEHLSHIMCRAMFAQGVAKQEEQRE